MRLHPDLLAMSMFSSVLSQHGAQQTSSPVFEKRGEGEKSTSKWWGVLMGARDGAGLCQVKEAEVQRVNPLTVQAPHPREPGQVPAAAQEHAPSVWGPYRGGR